MALEDCRECGNAVSTEARTCPKCGVPDPTGPRWPKGQCLGCGKEIAVQPGGSCPHCGVEDPLTPHRSTRKANGPRSLAMMPCRGCGVNVSTEAQACPNCGAAAPTRRRSADWVPCPKCGSAKTQRIGPGAMGFFSLVMGSCLLWIPIIGWVLAPIFFLGALLLWISALLPSGKVSFQCQSCKGWFSVPKGDLS